MMLVAKVGVKKLVENVNKFVLIHTGYIGLLKKGHLIFDACFESVEAPSSGQCRGETDNIKRRESTMMQSLAGESNFQHCQLQQNQEFLQRWNDSSCQIHQQIKMDNEVYQFAYCYPYTCTRLQHYLDNLERRNMDYFKRDLLGLSVTNIAQ
ncbi:cytosolic carboxypeptidase 6 isoform X2 [Narcine bancroftii]|uniref:cytosolic carboxypeptidase 6 isoform X2 n=1 Tax=Narcine bancroftii TaxID=1343680 RepID=UPI0038317AB9